MQTSKPSVFKAILSAGLVENNKKNVHRKATKELLFAKVAVLLVKVKCLPTRSD